MWDCLCGLPATALPTLSSPPHCLAYSLLDFLILVFHPILLSVYFFFMFQIVDLNPGFLPFNVDSLCGFFFISLRVAFISSLICFHTQMTSLTILITIVLNSAFDKLAIFHLVLFLEFCYVLSFGPFLCLLNLAPAPCLFVCWVELL